jgi:hypothetical protein
VNWAMANRLGHIAATKAHTRLGVEVEGYPVNVCKAIDDAGLSLMRRPLPRLFGVYIEANGNRGVMVNSSMTRATRRHTAAHELGHHEFGHCPDPARQCAVEGTTSDAAAPTKRGQVRVQGPLEMSAEAFAAWFLMPRKAMMAAMMDLGIQQVSSARQVYQLSLRLGTTYRATCRHLESLRFSRRADVEEWGRVSPGRLKRSLATEIGVALDSTFDMDVWDLRSVPDSRIEASVGDFLVLPAGLLAAVDSAGLAVVGSVSATIVVECVRATACTRLVHEGQKMSIVVHDRPIGLYLPTFDLSLGGADPR